jgi:hypothetical protein
MKAYSSPKPYKYSKLAGRYIPTSKRNSREFYYIILQEISYQEFNPNSTYGKFIMNKITPLLREYRTLKTKNKLSDLHLEMYKRDIQDKTNEIIDSAKKKQLENRSNEIQLRAYHSNKVYKFINDYEFIIPIPISLTPFFYLEIVYGIGVGTIIYFIFIQIIFNYQTNIREKFWKLPEYQYDSTEIKSIMQEQLKSNQLKLDRFKTEQRNEHTKFIRIKNTIEETFKRLREDNWIEFVLSPLFYSSTDWNEIRLHAFDSYEHKCVLCGATSNLAVDHIKPRSKHPELALSVENIQILCFSCNSKKGNKI